MFTTNATVLLLLAILVMGVVAFTFFRLFRLITAYKITDDCIKVLLFHFIPIYKIKFTNIEKIYEQQFHEVALVPGWHFPSRVFGRRVTIELKDAWFKFAFLTPEDTSAFISEIQKHVRTKS